MKKFILVFSFACFALSSAQAFATNLSGTWKGSGRAIFSSGKTIDCEAIVLTISQTASSLSATPDLICAGQPIKIAGGTLEVRGNELFDKGMNAGVISESDLAMVIRSKIYEMQVHGSFNDNNLNLQGQASIGKNPQPVITLEIRLQR